MMVDFIESQIFKFLDPSVAATLRGVVLFGRNSASYKFALAKSVLGFAYQGTQAVAIDDLAGPFSQYICEHLKLEDRQATRDQSQFLNACRQFNNGSIAQSDLIATTIRLGFENVIDAFHVLGQGNIDNQFFLDERKTSKRILLADNFLSFAQAGVSSYMQEVEARWRLVETAWGMNLAPCLIEFNDGNGDFEVVQKNERVAVTSARAALNGYQKGACFYCFRDISIAVNDPDLADVDHVFPHVLQRHGILEKLDGIWNLVLACKECNRGLSGKFANLPDLTYVDQLRKRNDFLVSSHHPLRETIIGQTGNSDVDRFDFLQAVITAAREQYPGQFWKTHAVGVKPF